VRCAVGALYVACILLYWGLLQDMLQGTHAAAPHSSLHASNLRALCCCLLQSRYCAACMLFVGPCRSSYSSSMSRRCRTAVGACPQMPCASCWSCKPMVLGDLCRHRTS
jgi:hypothetical protein